jgi:DNA polymerase-3 subunit delta'
MNWEMLEQKQPNVVKILQNSIERNRLAHSYLFKGSKGTGKRAAAIMLAKSYFCKEKRGFIPCGKCGDCTRIESGNHPDAHVVAPDGQSIKIDQIRQLQKEFSYLGVESRRKIYILEHAEKMTTQAANSLLKFLEEPGQMTIAVLLTEQAHLLLDTIVSRCQVLSFSPLSPQSLSDTLTAQEVRPHLARTIACLTNDQQEAEQMAMDEWFAQAREKMIQLMEELIERPHHALLFIHQDWLHHFKEKDQLSVGLDLLLLWYKDVMLTQLEETQAIINIDQKEKLSVQALHTSQKKIRHQMMIILDAKRRLYANMNAQLMMEQLVLRLQEG